MDSLPPCVAQLCDDLIQIIYDGLPVDTKIKMARTLPPHMSKIPKVRFRELEAQRSIHTNTPLTIQKRKDGGLGTSYCTVKKCGDSVIHVTNVSNTIVVNVISLKDKVPDWSSSKCHRIQRRSKRINYTTTGTTFKGLGDRHIPFWEQDRLNK